MKQFMKYSMAAIFTIAVVLFLSSIFHEEATTQEPGGSLRDNFGTRVLFQNYGTTRLKPVALASAVTLTVPQGTMFGVTGVAKTTRILNGASVGNLTGRVVIFVSASTDTLIDGVNLKLAGNFNGTADDVIALMYSPTGAAADTFWVELWRAVN